MFANVLRDGPLVCDHLPERALHALDVCLILIRNHFQINNMFPSHGKVTTICLICKHLPGTVHPEKAAVRHGFSAVRRMDWDSYYNIVYICRKHLHLDTKTLRTLCGCKTTTGI